MPQTTLYWVDDETRYYTIIKMLCPPSVKLKVYAGSGRTKDFVSDIKKTAKELKDGVDKQNTYFLLDVFMPVPDELTRLSAWSDVNYGAMNRDHVCGIALARYLHEEAGVYASNIKLLSSYGSQVRNEVSIFNTDDFKLTENELWDKGKVMITELKKWLGIEE